MLVLLGFTMVFDGRRGLICSDLRGANQLQISANQRAETHRNAVACKSLQIT